jgi:hypothetical protein
MKNKTFWDIIIGTFAGATGEGSSKRATSFYLVVVILSSLTAIYEYCFYLSSISLAPTSVQIAIVNMYKPIHFSIQLSVWMFFGLATIETVTTLVRTIKGDSGKNDPENK